MRSGAAGPSGEMKTPASRRRSIQNPKPKIQNGDGGGGGKSNPHAKGASARGILNSGFVHKLFARWVADAFFNQDPGSKSIASGFVTEVNGCGQKRIYKTNPAICYL